MGSQGAPPHVFPFRGYVDDTGGFEGVRGVGGRGVGFPNRELGLADRQSSFPATFRVVISASVQTIDTAATITSLSGPRAT
jgi:hypothetical protein